MVGSCHGGQLSPVGSCPRWAVAPVGSCRVGRCRRGQLSGGEMSAHQYEEEEIFAIYMKVRQEVGSLHPPPCRNTKYGD